MDRLISADELKKYCLKIADTCKGLHTTALNKIGHGESETSAIGAMAYFMRQETMYRFEIPNIIDNYANDNPSAILKMQEFISVSERLPEKSEYREKGTEELIPLLVCIKGTEYPFRAMYDGKSWGDGISKLDVTYWMPLPQPPKDKP